MLFLGGIEGGAVGVEERAERRTRDGAGRRAIGGRSREGASRARMDAAGGRTLRDPWRRFPRRDRAPTEVVNAPTTAPTIAPVMPPTEIRPTALRRCVVALAVLPLAAGCASYAERTSAALGDYRAGRFERAAEAFEDKAASDPFLAGAEAGMVRLTAGDWDGARTSLARAAQAAKEAEERALLSATDGLENLGTLLVNDTVGTYEGEGYERVLVHVALAIAYLGLGDVDGMRVEARRANQVLEGEEALYESDYGAGGLGHLLSAISYEMEGRLDEALIDYRRMVEKGVGLELAGPRLAELVEFFDREDLRALVADYEPVNEVDGTGATIWLLAGAGLGPYKTEAQITLPTGEGLVRLTAPQYASRGAAPLVTLELPDGDAAVRGAVVEDVERVARENLDDRLALAALRTGARALVRGVVRHELEEQHGGLAAAGIDLLSLALERADLRGWLTLPREWQAARVPVEAGTHTLELTTSDGRSVPLGRYALEDGETMLVFARDVDGGLYAHPIGGLRVEATTATGPTADDITDTP